MHTTTPTRLCKHKQSKGFTLAEVLIATALSSLILAGVITSVLMISRSGYRLVHYIDMETEARAALETIAVDARVTKSLTWERASETAPLSGITLVAPDNNQVRYQYDSSAGTLTRTDHLGTTRVLVSGIQSLTFTAYKYADDTGLELVDPAVTSTTNLNRLTKMMQISLSSMRSRSTLADATNNVVSARYLLRNKIQVN